MNNILQPQLRRYLKGCLNHLRVRVAAAFNNAPAMPFLILGEARTGTNLLADLLRSHPEISVAGEILNPYNPDGIRLWCRTRGSVLRHIDRSLRALDGICRGAQTHIYHFRLHRIPIEYLCKARPKLRFLVIFRKSLGEQFVSWKLAKLSGRWVGTSDKAVHHDKCIVDPVEFRKWCAAVRERYAEVTACNALWMRAVSIAYEDLCHDQAEVMQRKIVPFLGVEPIKLKTRLRKQNPRSLADSVENYGDVADLLCQERLETIGPC